MTLEPGRNDPCPCGSGNRYKHCHGAIHYDDVITRGAQAAQIQLLLHQEAEKLRKRHQGLGRPIISQAVEDGRRLVFVGQRCMHGKWKTFPDFLMDYMRDLFKSDWGNAELAKPPEDRHPLLNFYQRVCLLQQEAEAERDASGIYKSRMTGAASIYLGLAYNLYCVEHNARTQPDWDRWLHKLRTAADFDATCYEAVAAGACIRASFVLDFEDEGQRGKHPEFIATYPSTGRRFAVECKRRSGGVDGAKALEVAHLNKAFDQNKTGLPLIAFIELDRPIQYSRDEGMPTHLRGAIGRLERHAKSLAAAELPPAYVMLTNQPQGHFPDESVGFVGYVHGFKIPEMEYRESGPLEDLVAARDAHPEVHALLKSLDEHSHVPNSFDGREPYDDPGLKSPLDYYDFMHGAYKDTPREKLLEFIRDWPGQEELRALSQSELAKRYAIHWALNMLEHVKKNGPGSG